MVNVVPYLMVKNGKEAIEYYKELFGVKVISHQPFNEEVGKQFGFADDFDYENSTMHSEIELFGSIVYLSDNTNADDSKNFVELVINLDSKEQIDQIYSQVEKLKCEIKMKLEKTFWGAYYARFTDKYGVRWQLNYSLEE